MNLQQLDGVLRLWKGRLSTIAGNLLELQSQTAYQMLTGTGGLEQVELTGSTAAQVQPALREVRNLFTWFGLLQATIERAETLRRDMPAFFGAEIRVRQLQQILFTRSIAVEQHEVPFATRNLLSRTVHTDLLSPEELLTHMAQRFARVRDVVTSVEQAWSRVDSGLRRAESEAQRLRRESASADSAAAQKLAEVQSGLERVKAELPHDPLGALMRLQSQIEPQLRLIQEAAGPVLRLNDDLLAASQRWHACHALHEAAVIRWAEMNRQVQAERTPIAPVAEHKVTEAGERLDELNRQRDQGSAQAAIAGLRAWSDLVEAILAQDKRVLDACEDQLALKGELRSRLQLLQDRVRMADLTHSWILCDLNEKAAILLRHEPTDLGALREALTSFEAEIRSATSHRRSSPFANAS